MPSENEKYRENIIVKLIFEFSLGVIEYCETIEKLNKFVIAKQLLRSGTSIGANVREAQNAESKADFLHKMKIALKEADEAEYWLFLCKESKNYPDAPKLIELLTRIRQILNKIISTTKKLNYN